MATIYRTASWEVDGSLADPTSMKLSNLAATFGVKRNDTDAVVVADNTSMTKIATGIYEYSFTEPAANLTYTIALEVVDSGITWRYEEIYEAPSTTEIDVCNKALRRVGAKTITSLSDGSHEADVCNEFWPQTRDEVTACHPWNYAKERVKLYAVAELEVDTGPAPADWAADATLTGASSGATCTVVSKISSTVYEVNNISGSFSDGEVISDGTNSVDCAADYPVLTHGPEFGYDYQYEKPSDALRAWEIHNPASPTEPVVFKTESGKILTNQTDTSDNYSCKVLYIKQVTDLNLVPSHVIKVMYMALAAVIAEPLKQDRRFATDLAIELRDIILPKAQDMDAEEESKHQSVGTTGFWDENR